MQYSWPATYSCKIHGSSSEIGRFAANCRLRSGVARESFVRSMRPTGLYAIRFRMYSRPGGKSNSEIWTGSVMRRESGTRTPTDRANSEN
uniref:hypothetical protein n=1 Tax=Gordonia rubripertincta TaxID=36822 RepID=UPI0035B414DB